MDAELVSEGDEVVCIASVFDGGSDAVIRVTVDETVHTGIYDLFVNSRAEPSVIRDVFEVAIELGQKGQKGKPVGALFVVGDAGKVMNKSRPLSYNPFEKSHVHVGDPIVNVMLKEFSRLDGAFVVSDSGKIVSAYRYLEPGAEGVDIPKGLGARHMAGGAITRDTNATAIVLSESDGLVRGRLRRENSSWRSIRRSTDPDVRGTDPLRVRLRLSPTGSGSPCSCCCSGCSRRTSWARSIAAC